MRYKIYFSRLIFTVIATYFSISNYALAFSDDPESKGVDFITGILFGRFGTGVCALIFAGSCVAAGTGSMKLTDLGKIVLLIFGYLGAPMLVQAIKGFL